MLRRVDAHQCLDVFTPRLRRSGRAGGRTPAAWPTRAGTPAADSLSCAMDPNPTSIDKHMVFGQTGDLNTV